MTIFQKNLMNAAIEFKTDKAGRQYAQYFSRPNFRWIRLSMDDANAVLSMRAEVA